jgi:hypothetical protein
MSDIENGGPAFPTIIPKDVSLSVDGMSLRDWFAGQALVGLLAPGTKPPSPYEFSRLSYLIADGMIAARKTGGGDV